MPLRLADTGLVQRNTLPFSAQHLSFYVFIVSSKGHNRKRWPAQKPAGISLILQHYMDTTSSRRPELLGDSMWNFRHEKRASAPG